MRKRDSSNVAMATLLLVAAACGEVSGPDPDALDIEFVSEDAIAATADGESVTMSDQDESAAALPGFGGLWFDRMCNLHVVLTPEGDPRLTIETLRPLLRRKLEANPDCPPGATIVLHRGQFTLRELTGWADALGGAQVPGVAGIRVNVPLNRILVGVPNRPVAYAVWEAAERLGVPQRAIAFRLVVSRRR